jgi:DNA polymerase III epsilon subunit-like protein
MLDLETMGEKSYSAIVSIAAVPFNLETGQVSEKIFYQVIDLQSCLDLNLRVTGNTVYWWMNREREAQNNIRCNDKKPIKEVLDLFGRFFSENMADQNNATVWGNSAKFDLGILENAYQVARLVKPWNTWKEADVRTIVNKYGMDIKQDLKFEGIKHYAVDDCKHQIKYLCAIHNRIIRAFHALKNGQNTSNIIAKPTE